MYKISANPSGTPQSLISLFGCPDERSAAGLSKYTETEKTSLAADEQIKGSSKSQIPHAQHLSHSK